MTLATVFGACLAIVGPSLAQAPAARVVPTSLRGWYDGR